MDRPPRNTLPRSARIRAKSDFDRIFQVGLRASDCWLTLLAAPHEGPTARLGISVSRRYGNAVRRNHIKRFIREAFRTLRRDLPPGVDWVVIPRPGGQAGLADIQNSLRGLSQRLARRIPGASGRERLDSKDSSKME